MGCILNHSKYISSLAKLTKSLYLFAFIKHSITIKEHENVVHFKLQDYSLKRNNTVFLNENIHIKQGSYVEKDTQL